MIKCIFIATLTTVTKAMQYNAYFVSAFKILHTPFKKIQSFSGLSWVLGYFAISDARLPFHYAFTILNSLQGFFIFVLFVLRKKQVRDQWLIACCCRTPDRQKAQRSLSASASIPSTCSGKSTRSTSSTSSLQPRTDRSDSCKTTTSFISAEYDTIYSLPYSKASRDSLYYRKF